MNLMVICLFVLVVESSGSAYFLAKVHKPVYLFSLQKPSSQPFYFVTHAHCINTKLTKIAITNHFQKIARSFPCVNLNG